MIELSVLVSVVSVTISFFVAVSNAKRNNTAEDKKEAAELTTVIVKLENINDDTKEIKNELRSIRNEVSELRERVIVAEQAAKSLHKRVDAMEVRMKNLNGNKEE